MFSRSALVILLVSLCIGCAVGNLSKKKPINYAGRATDAKGRPVISRVASVRKGFPEDHDQPVASLPPACKHVHDSYARHLAGFLKDASLTSIGTSYTNYKAHVHFDQQTVSDSGELGWNLLYACMSHKTPWQRNAEHTTLLASTGVFEGKIAFVPGSPCYQLVTYAFDVDAARGRFPVPLTDKNAKAAPANHLHAVAPLTKHEVPNLLLWSGFGSAEGQAALSEFVKQIETATKRRTVVLGHLLLSQILMVPDSKSPGNLVSFSKKYDENSDRKGCSEAELFNPKATMGPWVIASYKLAKVQSNMVEELIEKNYKDPSKVEGQLGKVYVMMKSFSPENVFMNTELPTLLFAYNEVKVASSTTTLLHLNFRLGAALKCADVVPAVAQRINKLLPTSSKVVRGENIRRFQLSIDCAEGCTNNYYVPEDGVKTSAATCKPSHHSTICPTNALCPVPVHEPHLAAAAAAPKAPQTPPALPVPGAPFSRGKLKVNTGAAHSAPPSPSSSPPGSPRSPRH